MPWFIMQDSFSCSFFMSNVLTVLPFLTLGQILYLSNIHVSCLIMSQLNNYFQQNYFFKVCVVLPSFPPPSPLEECSTGRIKY